MKKLGSGAPDNVQREQKVAPPENLHPDGSDI